MATMNFKLNPENYLGLQHDKFKSDMMQIALTNPTRYYAIRNNVMQNTVGEVVKDMYEKIYYLLTIGSLKSTEPASAANNKADNSVVPGGENFIPNMSEKEVSDFAMSCATTMRTMLVQAIHKLLPDDYINLASSRLASQASTRNINTA
jgi:hypothetical protein